MLLLKLKVSNNIKLDFFHLEEQSSSNDDIFANTKYKPTLNNYSRFLATFDDATTIASGIADVALGYTFSIYRETSNSNQLVYVARIGEGNLSITDYNIVNDTSYKYYIFKEDESAISEAVMSNEAKTCWWDWSLTDLIPSDKEDNLYHADVNNIWKFSLNVASAERMQNFNSTTYNNLTRYPKVSIGKLNYSTGSLTCLLGNIQKINDNSMSYIEPAAMLDAWNDFCTNGNIKLLKDRKGNSMLVMINSSSAQTDDVTKEQANTITFGWVQIGDSSDVTVVG